MRTFLAICLVVLFVTPGLAIDRQGMQGKIYPIREALNKLERALSDRIDEKLTMVGGDLIIELDSGEKQEYDDLIDNLMDELDTCMDELEAEFSEGE